MNKDVRWTTPKLLSFFVWREDSQHDLGVPPRANHSFVETQSRRRSMRYWDDQNKGRWRGPDRRQDVQELGSRHWPAWVGVSDKLFAVVCSILFSPISLWRENVGCPQKKKENVGEEKNVFYEKKVHADEKKSIKKVHVHMSIVRFLFHAHVARESGFSSALLNKYN